MNGWNYNGDSRLENGGFYWKEDGSDDYVLSVDVTPCAADDGADNIYRVSYGSIFIGDDQARIASALITIGETIETASRENVVYAMRAYCGLDGPSESVIRIGKEQESNPNGWNPEPDTILHGNASLRKYIERNYL
jgi:hypothetical protein